MRSTKAGVTIGRALEDLDCKEGQICKVLVLVNTSYSSGMFLKVAMGQDGIALDVIPADFDVGRVTLSQMLREKKDIVVSPTLSEIFTDRLAAALEIISPRILTQGLVVESISALDKEIAFKDDVIFFGRPYFTTDTAGFALIKAGERKVEVKFEREYLDQPVVVASISQEAGDNEDSVFNGNLNYIVSQKSVKGFTIRLNQTAQTDTRFSWIALAVKNAKTFSSAVESLPDNISPETVNTGASSSAQTEQAPPPADTSADSTTNTAAETPSDTATSETENTSPAGEPTSESESTEQTSTTQVESSEQASSETEITSQSPSETTATESVSAPEPAPPAPAEPAPTAQAEAPAAPAEAAPSAE